MWRNISPLHSRNLGKTLLTYSVESIRFSSIFIRPAAMQRVWLISILWAFFEQSSPVNSVLQNVKFQWWSWPTRRCCRWMWRQTPSSPSSSSSIFSPWGKFDISYVLYSAPTIWGVPSFVMFCFVFFGKFRLPIGGTIAAVSAQWPVEPERKRVLACEWALRKY